MRRFSIVLIPLLLLTGCIRDSATYYGDGTNVTVTVRAEQEYFWDKRLGLKLVAARLPDCQRAFPLTQAASGVNIQLYGADENTFTLKSAEGTWTFETRNCTMLQPAAQTGKLIGTYTLNGDEVTFQPAPATKTPAPSA